MLPLAGGAVSATSTAVFCGAVLSKYRPLMKK